MKKNEYVCNENKSVIDKIFIFSEIINIKSLMV